MQNSAELQAVNERLERGEGWIGYLFTCSRRKRRESAIKVSVFSTFVIVGGLPGVETSTQER